jgi:O-acetyl-ADP-ribose deacetylase (regulator of RNase III)
VIIETCGDLLAADAEALTNPVNTAGVMGAGLALKFHDMWPENFRAYRGACARGEVRIGRVFVWESHQVEGVRYIANFPTKSHWKCPSRINDIAEGLRDLRQAIFDYEISSIAVPALGCGLGGLDWRDVFPLIVAHLGDLDGVRVLVYPPH